MTIWCMHIACWITKATNTHTDCVILLFHCNSGCKYAPQCYVICTSPGMFNIVLFFMYRLLTIFVPLWILFNIWVLIVFTQTYSYYVLCIQCQCAVRIDGSEIPVCMYICIYVCVCVYTEHDKCCITSLVVTKDDGVTLFTSITEWDAKLILAVGYFCCFLLL